MKKLYSAIRNRQSAIKNWLPDMDLNHDKQIQSLLCYRYTIGQAGAFDRLNGFPGQSSRQAKAESDTNWEISLAPGFSRVPKSWRMENRFNGFFAVRPTSCEEKPLKRLCCMASHNTGLKPGANERTSVRHPWKLREQESE